MPYRGHVRNGMIVLDESVNLEDGTTVIVEVTGKQRVCPAAPTSTSRTDRYRDLIGALEGLPEDWSREHDRYLRESHG